MQGAKASWVSKGSDESSLMHHLILEQAMQFWRREAEGRATCREHPSGGAAEAGEGVE
jgi:hypothetical protein